jgi:NitT/TauT family transport system permease protein
MTRLDLAHSQADPLAKVRAADTDRTSVAPLRRRGRRGVEPKLLAARLVTLAVILLLWQYFAEIRGASFWVGSPGKVSRIMWDWATDGTLIYNLSFTVRTMALGFLCAAVLGVAFGLLFGLVASVGRVAEPFLMAFYSMPTIGLVPLYILYFGIGLRMRIILVATVCFFLVFLNTYAGVRQRDEELEDVLKVMRARRRHIILKLVIPGALPQIVTGLKLAIPYSLTASVFAEIIAANRGMGYLLSDAASQFNTSGVFAALVLLMIMAVVINGILNRVADYFLRWQKAGR